MIEAVPGKVLIEIEMPDETAAAKLKERSGLLMAPPSKSAIPTTGWIFDIGKGAKVEYKVGDHIVFSEPKPSGFHFEGKRLMSLEPKQIIALIKGD